MTVTLVLDLDDTLYLEEHYVRSGVAAVADWAEQDCGIVGFADAVAELRRAGVRKKLFDRSLIRLGVEPRAALIEAFVTRYREHYPDIALADDVDAFFRRDHGCRLALITDGFGVAQHRKIDALQLRRFGIDPIICTDDWGRKYWKPHRRAFDKVAAARGYRGDFIYVADNPAKDFLAPRKLGWHTIQIDRPGAIHSRTPPTPDHGAHIRISSFADLTPQNLGRLVAAPGSSS